MAKFTGGCTVTDRSKGSDEKPDASDSRNAKVKGFVKIDLRDRP